jgi:hypothetical protein
MIEGTPAITITLPIQKPGAPEHLVENEIPVAKACRGGWSKKRKVPIAGRGCGRPIINVYNFLVVLKLF